MTLPLYETTVKNWTRTAETMVGVLAKGRAHYQETNQDIEQLATTKLCDDMFPLSFQINSIRHHSVNAIAGVKAGEFAPPTPLEKTDYTSLEAHLKETVETLKGMSEEEVNSLNGGTVIFKLGSKELPFTAADFLMSFSVPNFLFHATTTYNILRMNGVPIGKRDFLGSLPFKRG